MNKFEKLMEYIINDEDSKARALFHDIVVEKSRDIYESLMDEEQVEETFAAPAVAGNEVEEMVDDVSAEEAMGEDDEEGAELELGGDDAAEFGNDDAEFGDEEEVADEPQEIEDKVMNIDAKLDELLAKFDEIMGDDSAEEMPAEEPAFGGEEEMGAEELPMMEAEDCDDEEDDEEDKEESKGNPFAKKKTEESRTVAKTATELMREYVETIGNVYSGQGDAAEGDAVGAAGKKVAVNTKPGSVGPGNNFGGTAVTSKGGNQDQDGKSPAAAPKPQEIKSGNQNVPGGKAALAKGPSAKSGEESAVNDKPVQAQNTGKK
jgi:hypothetical protein